MMSVLQEINQRYTKLANQDCCISCGKAIQFAQPQQGEVCIDLGSGRGQDVIRMAQDVGSRGFAYGIDITPEMIRKAQSTAKKLNIENVKFIHCQLEAIDLPDACADLIISNCTINHANDKQAVWKEIHRLLKPGGRFSISDIYATTPVPEKYRNDPEAIAECWAGAVTREEYMDTVFNTGFTSVTITEESAPYPKGEIEVASLTITGKKELEKKGCCCQ